MIGLGVVAALEAEARTLGSSQQRADGHYSLRGGALLAVSGMGAACANRSAAGLADAGAIRLMSFGLAGGLDSSLAPGTIVLPEEIISEREPRARFAASATWRQELAARIGARRLPHAGTLRIGGRLLAAAAPIVSRADKAALFAATGAAAVDMESLAIAEVAAARGIPFIAVRVIVDAAGDTLPPSVVAASHASAFRPARLIAGLAGAPWEIAAVMRLALRYRAAMRSLSSVAHAVLA